MPGSRGTDSPCRQGPTDNRDFYSMGGWGGAGFATFPWLVWVFVISVIALRQRRATPA